MYNHNLIEKKWQKYWEENKTNKFEDLGRKKFYVLDMFPYPSGKGLHVGHPKGYTATDVISRFKKMNNYDVLHPIGWDAFGLPAEQYAIETNNHPQTFTEDNIKVFREQLKKIGFDYDYNKEVNTTDPKFYKWTQWIFTKLYENGLAEIKDIDVNWCEGLGTTLSNEEIELNKDGIHVSERGGFPVIKKPMRQWVLKITNYADRLIDDLETVDWPESLKSLQRKWIGRTDGYEFNFKTETNDDITVFTSKIHTINGVTALVLNHKHKLMPSLIKNIDKVAYQKFLNHVENISELDLKINNTKTGIFTGSYAIHPITKKKIPIWIGDYVLDNVGTGAIMLVPSEDERDSDFARQYNIEIIDSELFMNQFNDADKAEQENIINQFVETLSATKKRNYKLKDWVFSRQRYWGEPFPIMFDEEGKIHTINELPLLLPKCDDFKPNAQGQSPLSKIDSFINIEIENKKYKLDSNTMPQWAGSCWYYLAYLLKKEDGEYIDLNSPDAFEIFKKWLPVDIYVGGQEHAVLHLLYSRFWHKFLYDIKVVPNSEPFYKIINQGLILGSDGNKMSKSKGNVINPDDIINSHGADALRLYECFMGPVTASFKWTDEGLDSSRKWLDRVYRFYTEIDKKIIPENEVDPELRYIFHNFIKKFTNCINDQQFNVAISEMMICLNAFYKFLNIPKNYLDTLVMAISCFAPHLAEEIFQCFLNNKDSVSKTIWPSHNEKFLTKDKIKVPFQINGKLKKVLDIKSDLSDDEVIEIIYADIELSKLLENKKIKNKIIVKNKIINFIVEQGE
ncbi:MAG: leucine--tRNA ligase [Mycoplasma sp.]